MYVTSRWIWQVLPPFARTSPGGSAWECRWERSSFRGKRVGSRCSCAVRSRTAGTRTDRAPSSMTPKTFKNSPFETVLLSADHRTKLFHFYRSGSNVSGSGQISGSMWSAMTGIPTCIPFGILIPARVMSRPAVRSSLCVATSLSFILPHRVKIGFVVWFHLDAGG